MFDTFNDIDDEMIYINIRCTWQHKFILHGERFIFTLRNGMCVVFYLQKVVSYQHYDLYAMYKRALICKNI